MSDALKRLLEWYLPSIAPSDRVAMDVGAHLGHFSRMLIDTTGINQVIAYEASAATSQSLRSEMLQYSATQFTAYNLAVGKAAGTASLHSDDDTATASILPYKAGYPNNGVVNTSEVIVTTLDAEINRLGIDPVMVKIDTQGNDLSVLLGAKMTLAKHRAIFQVEMIYSPLYEGQCTPKQLEDEFRIHGYNLYSLNDIHIDEYGRLSFCDAIFCPSEISPPRSNSFLRIDDLDSYMKQISDLHLVCEERLVAINLLDHELKRINARKLEAELPWWTRFHKNRSN